jgi:glycosyltransferase involved in cell wall biosynthesis
VKVLFLHNVFHVESGSGTCMFQEASALAEAGHEVHFFTTDKAPYRDEAYPHAWRFPRHVEYGSLSLPGTVRHLLRPFRNREAEAALASFLDALKPDVVHEQTTSFQLTPAVLRPCYARGVPVVLTIHGPGFFCPAQGLVRGDGRRCAEESCLRGSVLPCLRHRCLREGIAKSVATALVHDHYRRAGYYDGVAAFVCASRAMLDLSLRAGIPADKLALVPYGLERSWFDPLPEGGGGGDYFLFAGRLDRVKGVHHLLHAMVRLPRTVRLVVAGSGPEEGALRRQAETLGLGNVEFAGWKEGTALEELYGGAVAAVLPCDWFEAFGLTLAESFARGRPVVASRVGGVPEVVDHGEDGFLVEPGDVEGLASAMAALLGDRGRADAMGRRGREKAEGRYHPRIHLDNLLRVYGSVTSGRMGS